MTSRHERFICLTPALSHSCHCQTSLMLPPPNFDAQPQTGSEAKSIPCHLRLVIARLAVAPSFSRAPAITEIQWGLAFLAGCRMYILIRNKVLQLSVHFLLGYFNKLELWEGKNGNIVLCASHTRHRGPSCKHNFEQLHFAAVRKCNLSFQR